MNANLKFSDLDADERAILREALGAYISEITRELNENGNEPRDRKALAEVRELRDFLTTEGAL